MRRSPTSVVSAFLHAARIGGILIHARTDVANAATEWETARGIPTVRLTRRQFRHYAVDERCSQNATLREKRVPTFRLAPAPLVSPSNPHPSSPTSEGNVAPCMCCNSRTRIVDYLFGLNGKEFTLERDRVRRGSAEFFVRDATYSSQFIVTSRGWLQRKVVPREFNYIARSICVSYYVRAQCLLN